MNAKKKLERVLKQENNKLPKGITVNWETTPRECNAWNFNYGRSTMTVHIHKINHYDKNTGKNKKVNLFTIYNGDGSWSSENTLVTLLKRALNE